jgi:hypothetical protein
MNYFLGKKNMEKKLRIMIFVCVLLLSLLLFGCDRSFYFKNTESTDLSQEELDGLRLHQNINDEWFIRKYGKQTNKSSDNEFYNYYLLSNGLEIATTDDGEIVRIMGHIQQTHRGITFGDSKNDVIEAYGENFYHRIEQGTDIIGYIDWEINATLEFWLDHEEKIVEIRFDDVTVQ